MKFTGSLFRSIRTKNLSYNGFQERLQKVSNEKTTLEQKKNEITVLLSSSDAKIIQPELIQILLEQFLLVYKQASRDRQKHLLQLLLQKITIKHPNGQSRTVDTIEIEFDFSEVNISKTFTLIHMLYRKTDNEDSYSQPIPASDNKIPPYLQLFLPLFVIRFTATHLNEVFISFLFSFHCYTISI
ncbi:hypothetical protein QNH20_26720 [Neobacillus sp. WH10]|uniref:hypothetical protein n=1 Tax=Neobacillus sp. WH10 TaxID=3047873 RepID=UPI0024C12B2E|nr:hypothetical protein [Neobacillus sp. WH10]WHY77604.1 hypothetical protein QNH20_26720 [Neobacillus sp. WH10]